MQMNIKVLILRTIISCAVSLLILGFISYCIPDIQMNKPFKLNNRLYNLNSYEYTIASSCVVPYKNVSLERVIGHEDVIQEITTLIDIMNCSNIASLSPEGVNFDVPKGILLYGPPGTGKTTLAKSISSSIFSDKKNSANFLMVSPDVIENKFYGESLKLLKAVFTLAKKIEPCVIFFDEIDGILSARTAMDQSHTTSMKTSFLTYLDGVDTNSVLLIGATNREKALDPALLRRLSVHLKLDNPSDQDKKKMLSNYFTALSDTSLSEILELIPSSMTLSDIECFCKYCYRHFFSKHKQSGDSMTVEDISKMYPIYEKFRVN